MTSARVRNASMLSTDKAVVKLAKSVRLFKYLENREYGHFFDVGKDMQETLFRLRNVKGQSLLHIAAMDGNPEVVEFLMKCNLKKDLKDVIPFDPDSRIYAS